MTKLLRFLKNYKKEAILGPVFKLFEASFELLVPLVVAALIDTGISGGNRGYVINMALIMVLLGVVGLVSTLFAQYYAAKASAGFTAGIRKALFAHIQRFSFTELDEVGSSTLITRMTSDANQVQTGMNLTLRLALRSPFIVLGAAVMAFTVDATSAMIFVGLIPVLAVVIFLIMLTCIPLYKKVQQKLDGILSSVRQNLTGVRVFRAFCKEPEEMDNFSQKNQTLTSAQKGVGRLASLLNPLTFVIINIGIALLIHTGALRVEAGLLTQGAVVALYNYMSQILVELIKLANLIINITKSISCGNRIQAVFDIHPSQDSPSVVPSQVSPNATLSPDCPSTVLLQNRQLKPAGETVSKTAAVEFKNASVRYANAPDCALKDITLRAEKGQTIGIIGGTGSGKTTLVNLIPRFYDCEHGEVIVLGHNAKEYPIDHLRSRIGIVPQKAVLFKGSIRENLLWGCSHASDEALLAALRIAQAEELVRSKPGGLNFQLSAGGNNLSGGQKQRLTIARALVRKPEILILDDSSSALDAATDAALRSALKTVDATIFIVSQRAASLRYAHQILVLDNGTIAGLGTHDELLKISEIYREICASQDGTEATA